MNVCVSVCEYRYVTDAKAIANELWPQLKMHLIKLTPQSDGQRGVKRMGWARATVGGIQRHVSVYIYIFFLFVVVVAAAANR